MSQMCQFRTHAPQQAADHSNTSSAMASTPAGIERPSTLAIRRLIRNSNLVTCWTGRSAGFSPLRNPPDIDAGLTVVFPIGDSVAHQAARHRVVAPFVDRRYRVSRRQGEK